MQEAKKIDYSKLFGFETVSEEFSGILDLQDETVAAKLGAKVGGTESDGASDRKLDFGKLLGFETISDEVSGDVDFKADTLNAKLGAKVGQEAMQDPSWFPSRAKRDQKVDD